MANEFKVKNGLIVVGDLTTSGTITINGALAATQSWVISQAYLTSASLSGYATQSYVTSAISALIDAAPAALDTLNELAAALGDDASFSTTVTNSIAGKVAKSGDTMTGSLTFASTADNVRLQKNSSFLNLRDPYNNIHLYNAGDGTYIDANVHHWRSQGASYWMTLNGTGLGIGTQSPNSVLDIRRDGGGSTNPIPLTSWYGGNGGGNLVAKLEYTADAGIFTIGYAGLASWDSIVLDGGSSNGGSSIALKNDAVTTVFLRSSSGNNYINSGNVGIGTTNPTKKLEVADSDIKVNGVTIGKGPGTISGNINHNISFGVNNFSSYSIANRAHIGIGYNAFQNITGGYYSIAIGGYAMDAVIDPDECIAIGLDAMGSATYPGYSVAIGNGSLFSDTEGYGNIAIGARSANYLNSAFGGYGENTVVGNSAAFALKNARETTVLGAGALWGSTSHTNLSRGNTAVGAYSGNSWVSGRDNIWLGYGANGFSNGSYNVIIGANVSSTAIDGAGTLNNSIVLADGQGNVRIFSNSVGNVGIGTTSPGSKLSVFGNNDVFSVISQTGDTSFATRLLAQYVGLFNNGANGHHLYISSTQELGPGEFNITKTWGGFLTFGTSSDGTARTRTLYVNSSGYVGVGVNPTSGDKFEVAGTLRVHTGNNWDGIQIYAGGADGYIRGIGDETGLHIRSEYGNVLLADDRGSVGIGTTTPVYKLDVNGNARFVNEIYVGGVWSTTYGPRNSGDPINFVDWSSNVKARLTTNSGVLAVSDRKLSLGILDLNTSGTPGQFKIKTSIPWNYGGSDFTVNIKGFRYGSSQMVSLSIGWHFYNNEFYSRNAICNGAWAPTITLAKSPDGYVIIHLPSPNYWAKLYVESVYSSNSADSYTSGWSWSDADLSDCTVIQTVPYRDLATNISGNAATTSQTNFSTLTLNSATVATQAWVGSQGYLTSYSETDTLNSVTSRGATTSTNISVNTITIGTDATYGAAYRSVSFGYNGDGSNRILAANNTSDGMYFMAATGQGFNFRPNGGTANLVVINSAGNVGIGTTSPAYRLDVSGNSRTTGNHYVDSYLVTPYIYGGGPITMGNNVFIDSIEDGKLTLRVPSGDSSEWNYINFTGSNGVRDAYLGTDGGGTPTWYRDDNNTYISLGASGPTVNGSLIATQSYVTTQINNLINGAPGALDTLSELASALGNDSSFATTVTNSIASKLSLSGGTMTGQILFQTSALNNGFRWDVNSDAAGITFKNTGDGDNNSYFNFFTEDNGNEYFKFSHNTWNIGSFDFMDVKNGVVRTNGNIYVNASQSGTRSAGTNELINGNRVWHDGDFSSSNISNWNTAYGWGNHASAGYAAASSLANYLPLGGGTMTGNLTLKYDTSNNEGYNGLTFAPGSDDYIIKASTTYGVFGRQSFGWHVNATSAFGVYSSGWTKLFGVEGGTGNTQVFGNLTVNGVITESSSLKLKENVQTSEGNLEKVVNLRPVTYNKIGSQTTELGLIAEEVAEVYPEFVQYDENGEPVGVHYSRLTAALIGAVKELTNQVQELNKKING